MVNLSVEALKMRPLVFDPPAAGKAATENSVKEHDPAFDFPIIAPFTPQEIVIAQKTSPSNPSFPRSLRDIKATVKSKPFYTGPTENLSWNVKQMKVFLEQAGKSGKITWLKNRGLKPDYSYLYNYFQGRIDSTKENVYVLFGNTHTITEHISFFNELIAPGEDGMSINGITHLGLEAFNRGDIKENHIPSLIAKAGKKPSLYLHDTQSVIDYYLSLKAKGPKGEKALKEAHGFFRGFMQKVFKPYSKGEGIYSALIEALKISRKKGYKVVASDFSKYRLEHNLRNFTQKRSFRSAVREKMAVNWIAEKLDSGEKNVVFYLGGTSHVEKKALPVWIKQKDPRARVVSVVLNGGAFDKSWVFDQALRELGWEDKAFVLKLEGYREADMVIHLPNLGRETKYHYSTILRYPLVPFQD